MWIYAFKGKNATLIERLGQTDPASIALCSLVQAELWHGAHRYGNPEQRFDLLRAFFKQHKSFGFDDGAAAVYGQLRYQVERSGQVIGPMALLIAAIALTNELMLVTHDTKEFRRVAGLALEDWSI